MELNQMESIMGGSRLGCAFALAGLAIAFGGLVTATGGLGLIFAAASYTIAPTSAALSCLK